MFRRQVQSIFAFLLAVFMLVSASQSADAAAKWITFHNQTGRTIYKLNVWSGNISEPDDILGSGTFRNGSTFSVKIYTNYRYWNVRAFWDNTNYVIWRNIEITGANDVYLSDGNNIWWQ